MLALGATVLTAEKQPYADAVTDPGALQMGFKALQYVEVEAPPTPATAHRQILAGVLDRYRF